MSDVYLPPPTTLGGYTEPGYPRSLTYCWIPPVDVSGEIIPVNKYMLQIADVSQNIIDTYTLDSTKQSYRILDISCSIVYIASIKASIDDGITWGEEAFYSPARPVDIPYYAPESATAIRRGDDRTIVDINWTPPSIIPDFTGFYKIRSESSNPDDPIRGWSTTSFDDLTCTIYDLNPESTYVFTIVVVNVIGESPAAYTNQV
jgi:hypothetical protein